MRVATLEVQGFRAFGASKSFDFDADAIIVIAPNGTGKTSLFDAILWGLTGAVPRLGSDARELISLYSGTGEARVSLTLRSKDGAQLRITRRALGDDQQLRIEHNGEILQEKASAQSKLLSTLWPAALLTPDGTQALAAAVVRGVYLQQDLVRQFIESDDSEARFAAISELVGAGRATELQFQLERARTAWTRATNDRERESEALRARVEELEARLAASDQAKIALSEVLEERWRNWWQMARNLGATRSEPPKFGSADSAPVLDRAIKDLQALRRTCERRREVMSGLIAEGAKQPAGSASLGKARESFQAAEQEFEAARELLRTAQTEAAQEREAQIRQRETAEEIRTLAQLALRHLGDRCPVCDQTYDHQQTQARLQAIVGTQVSIAPPTRSSRVSALAPTVTESERALNEARQNLRDAEEAERALEEWTERSRRSMEEREIQNVNGRNILEALRIAEDQLSNTADALMIHEREAEVLSLDLARSAEAARRSEIELELSSGRKQLQELQNWLSERRRTGSVATEILDGLREAASEIVEFRLKRIEPLLQRIYAAIDPHPSFRIVKLLSRLSRGHGRLTPTILDPAANVYCERPYAVLSSSQMNALAVSVFLALNLGIAKLPLESAILDDPLQSLDDVNLLGLVDLLRRTKEHRQLFISTHDPRFGALLERKLRPVAPGSRTAVVFLENWSRSGPSVRQRDIKRSQSGLRVVA